MTDTEASTGTTIELAEVHKSFGSTRAVDGITLDLGLSGPQRRRQDDASPHGRHRARAQ